MFEYIWSKLLKRVRGRSIKDSAVHPSSTVEPGSMFVSSRMGKHSFCGYDCEIVETEIGAYCSIANGVVIGGGEHPVDWVSTSPVFYKGRDSIKAKFSEYERAPIKTTKIGNDVWIGRNVLIKQGVTIGTGAVIGMGSIVTKDIEPYAIVGGNPARHIRYRFSEELRVALLESMWWDLSDDKLMLVANEIRDPSLFLKGIDK